MKMKKWICPLLIVLCVAVSWIYEVIDERQTDTVPPQIIVETKNLQLSVNDPESVLLQGIRVMDDRDGDVTDSLIVESVKLLDKDGRIRVCYAALDRSGNASKINREAQYTDYICPRFTLSGPLVISDAYNFDLLGMIGAKDVVDGDIGHRIRVTNLSGYSMTEADNYEVMLSVTNSLGDTAQLKLPVEVLPIDRDYEGLTLTDYLIYLPVGAEFEPEHYLQELFTVNGMISLTEGLPEGYSLWTEGSVDTQTPGVYILDYQVGNTVYIGGSRLVVVVEE